MATEEERIIEDYLNRVPDFESWDARYFASITERLRAHCDEKIEAPFRLLPEELPLIMTRCYGAWQMNDGSAAPQRFPTLHGKLFGVETEIVFDRLAIISAWR